MTKTIQRGSGFVSFQVDYWDGPWQNRQAFLTALSRDRPVLFVSPPWFASDLVPGAGVRRTNLSGFKAISPGLWNWVPPRHLPTIYRLPRLRRVIERRRHAFLRRIVRRWPGGPGASLVWHPHAYRTWKATMNRPLIYYKYDHYAGYGGRSAADARFLDDSEQELMATADFVLVTSRSLFDLHQDDARDRLHFLPHGVDFEVFSGESGGPYPEPAEFREIPKPRIGYVGSINEKVDFRLVSTIAQMRRDVSFVFVGPDRCRTETGKREFAKMTALRNVHYLGPRAHPDVPAFLHHLDAGMMCYALTEWVKLGYPLKLHEYLAAGLPSIGTALPELEPFRRFVHIESTTEGWLQAIDEILMDKRVESVRLRRDFARQNSWTSRIHQFLSIVSPPVA
jgi:hypothetical protein